MLNVLFCLNSNIEDLEKTHAKLVTIYVNYIIVQNQFD